MTSFYERAIEILLIEDNPGDARLTSELLNEGKILNNLHLVVDGVEALHFLKRNPPYENAVRPDLILMDLNLPKLSGIEILKEIKGDTDLRRIPVIVLTTSSSEDDIYKSYELHANAYVTKPVDLDKFIEIIQLIEDFWIKIVRLPSK